MPINGPNILDLSKRSLLLLTWQVAASVAFLLLGGIVLGLPPWLLGGLELLHLGLMYLAYLISTAIPSAFALIQYRVHPLGVVVATAAIFVFAWLLSPLFEQNLLTMQPFLDGHKNIERESWHIPFKLMVTSGGFAALLNIALLQAPRTRLRVWAGLVGMALLMAVASLPMMRSDRIYRAMDQPLVHRVKSSKYPLQLNFFRARIPQPEVKAGGLVRADEELLLLTGDGLFYRLDFSADGSELHIQPLKYRAPLNASEFRDQTRGLSRFAYRKFRAMDLLIVESEDSKKKQLLVSHHYWNSAQSCHRIRVSAFSSPWREFLTGDAPEQWRTVYESQPCLPVNPDGKPFFAGHQAGGMMIQTAPQKILLALGDQGFDGMQTAGAVPQDMHSDYGKIIEIDVATGNGRIVTSGHRAPAGLHVDGRARIWLTEHGPRGGDELNRVRFGGDYGWPSDTLGSPYDSFDWPAKQRADRSRDFEAPVFAWTPSIGVSAVTSVNGGEFQRWNGSLIVASLAAGSLFVVHLEGDVPVMDEAIPVYERIRDVALDGKGRIVFWTDSAVIGLMRVRP